MTAIDSGKAFTVEDCQRLDFLIIGRQARAKLFEALIAAEIEALGFKLPRTTSRTGNRGVRYWFKCPLCGHRRLILLVHPVSRVVGCRRCLGLKYRSQRFKGMVEAEI